MPLTKIVCTLGPATDDRETLRAMIRAGMTVARLNFSHGDAEEKRRTFAMVREIADEEGQHVAIMGDLQGPKIRVGELPEDGIELTEGDHVVLTSDPVEDVESEIPFPHPDIIEDIDEGDRLLLDDGTMELIAENKERNRLTCRVLVGGRLKSHKGVNLPGVKLSLPALTEKDRADALVALDLEMDYLALSFVRRADDVKALREYLLDHVEGSVERQVGENPHRIPGLVSKIEKPEALDDLEGIVRASDAVMVARGDLGVEIAPERVPLVQKRIVHLCNQLGCPVITATQMLQSMIDLPRPTRAEASDVANAILDGSDAVMLSGETSIGKYPVEAVSMMARIAENVEQSEDFPYNQLLDMDFEQDQPNAQVITSAISRATVVLSMTSNAVAILSSTESGRTARIVARHRPKVPLLGITPFPQTARRMQMMWGLNPIVVEAFHHTDEMIERMMQAAFERHYVEVGDNVVLTAGIPLEVHGVTNMVKVHTIREADLT
ncbi:MAG: pyruvate kinase [Anaerolineae bacterium]